jgi:Skp family chaperone for outer membrane proteins
MNQVTTRWAALALATALAGPAGAQAPAAPAQSAAAMPGLTGPLVPGVCLLGRDDLIGHSRVGEAAIARLKVLAGQAQASIDAEKARLEARGKALEAKRATMTPQQFQTEGLALQHRAQALQTEFSERGHQIEVTRAKAYARVLQGAQPFVAGAFAAHKCGLLLAREAALGGNFGNDLTPEVLTAFDAKGSPVSFDLEPAAH